jgi:hypothetical protein
MRRQPGFFDIDERLQRLTELGDQLLAFWLSPRLSILRRSEPN